MLDTFGYTITSNCTRRKYADSSKLRYFANLKKLNTGVKCVMQLG